MATLEKYKMSVSERRRRHFSESFKRAKVREIELKQTTASEVCRQYEVSQTNVQRWMKKYGDKYQKGVRTIVELESDTRKIGELRNRIAELERLVGQKQIQLEFQEKMFEIAQELYGVDIKKKFDSKPSSGSGKTDTP
jgi:transposase